MHKIRRKALLVMIVVGLAITSIASTRAFDSAVASDGWTLIAQTGSKAYPDLVETFWQKNASALPHGPYDIIGLHRLVQTGIKPVGVLFVCPGTWGSGEQLLSNPPQDSYTIYEQYNDLFYWANRGFDVYSIDYRTHFVPITLNSSQLSFMADWGWDSWMSDIKEAVDKAKEVSGAERIYMSGESFGGVAAMNYATLYWKQDLKGLILLDPAAIGLVDGLGTKNPSPTNSYNLTDGIAEMNANETWAVEADSGALFVFKYADQNPGAPAEFPPGTPLPPPTNPFTGANWTNITEWAVVVTYYSGPPWGIGGISNILSGYGNATVVIHILATFDRYWPTRLGLEATAYSGWTDCPYVTHDFDDNYSEINVPLLAFQSQLFGYATFGPFRDGIANPDFNAITLLGYGHLDVFDGVYSERDVSGPAYNWLVNHIKPIAEFFFSPRVSWPNETILFNASSTVSPNGNITSYTWNFGDGNVTTTSEPIINHAYSREGSYAVSLNVTDIDGQWNSTARTITILLTDLNRDGRVNIMDITVVAVAYKTKPGDPNWNAIADLDRNGEINIIDITMVARDYGKTV